MRDHVRLGVRPKFTMFFPRCFSQCRIGAYPVLRPRSSCVLPRTVHVLRMSDSTDLPQGTGGNFATRRTSQVKLNQSPSTLSTGPVERTLFLGPNVAFHVLATLHSLWGFGVTTSKCFRPAPSWRRRGSWSCCCYLRPSQAVASGQP